MIKAIIFDFDGTLTNTKKGSNCWEKTWTEIDDNETDAILYNLYESGQINEKQWIDLIFKKYKENGVCCDTFLTIAKKIQLQNGIEKLFNDLHNKGIKIFILSGGITNIILETIPKQLRDMVESIEAYTFNYDKNGNLASYHMPKHNLENKSEFVNNMSSHYGISKSDILFVGNGKNDETASKSGVHMLCINPDDANFTNKNLWEHYIEKCHDLSQVMAYVNSFNPEKTF